MEVLLVVDTVMNAPDPHNLLVASKDQGTVVREVKVMPKAYAGVEREVWVKEWASQEGKRCVFPAFVYVAIG